jgi:alpha-glucosidase
MLKKQLLAPALFLLLGILSFVQGSNAAEALVVSSPDGNLTVSLALKSLPQPYLPGNRAYYRVRYKGAVILTDSPLGLDFLGSHPLDQDLEVVGTDRQSHDSTWENAFGTKRVIPDKYNQLTVSLRERRAPGRRVDVIFRAYNEGIGFRYFLPKQTGLEKFAMGSEDTGFYFAKDVSAYALNMGRVNTHNEAEFLRTNLNEIKPSSIINVPLLVDIPGGPWVALLEADLSDYPGMYVSGVPGFTNALVSRLSHPPRKEDVARNLPWPEYQMMEQPVTGTTPKETPWRALMVGPTPGSLIESNYLILNLSKPCAVADPSWIKPGKAAWDWWTGSFADNVPFTPGMNTPTMNHYIDFAARHHLEYMLIDGGWYAGDDITKPSPDINIAEIMDHAKQKGVKVILWVDWQSLDNQLDEAMALYERWGVAGIKVDGINRDDQEMVRRYEKWTRKAAEYHLVVDYHGAYKPTGLRRTYPNLLQREAVMGMEYSKWSDRVTPEYNVTIPFTRMLAGPMDYTPGGFRNTIRGQFKIQDNAPMTQGTRAHQLAMYVVYEAPLVMVSDYPEAAEGQPGLEFIEKVPTVWDETKVLNGDIGKYITIARQNNDAWYIGGMTNWDARDIEIPLSFLGSGEYDAQIFADGADADKVATSISITTKPVKATEKLNVHLAPGGGVAVILRPRK